MENASEWVNEQKVKSKKTLNISYSMIKENISQECKDYLVYASQTT